MPIFILNQLYFIPRVFVNMILPKMCHTPIFSHFYTKLLLEIDIYSFLYRPALYTFIFLEKQLKNIVFFLKTIYFWC